jgi:PST family polysaccharide transporter
MLTQLLGGVRARPLLQKILHTASWQVADKVVRMVVSLVIGVWVARYLGPSDFGLLNFGIAFVAIFTPIADCGLQAMVVRELVRRQIDERKILASAFALRAIGSCLAVACCMGGVLVLRPGDNEAHLVVLVVTLSLFAQSFDVIDFGYQARMQPRPMVLIRTASLLLFAMAKVVLIYQQASVLCFAVVMVGEVVLNGLLMCVLSSLQSRGVYLREAKWEEMKSLLAISWPMAVSALSVMLYMRIDQVMVGQMLDDKAVGIFSAAVRLSEFWYFIPMAALASVAPALTAAYGSQSDYENKLTVFIRAMVVVGIVMAIFLSLCAHPLIHILYGDEYSEAASVLSVHAWAGVFVSLGIATGPWFVNNGMAKVKMVHTLVGAVVNVGLNLYMIPRFGVTGAAVSTLVSYALAATALNAFSARTMPIAILQARAFLVKVHS